MSAADEHNPAIHTPAIVVKGLVKSFGSHLALRGVDFQVEPGESVVIFGPNGAGKTTLIKILATIMNPTSGEVLIDGMRSKDSPEKIRRRIGVITHQTFLYPNLTAYENLEFYCRLYDIPNPDKRIREVTATVDMTSRLRDRVGTLSRACSSECPSRVLCCTSHRFCCLTSRKPALTSKLSPYSAMP